MASHEMQHADSPTWCIHCGTFDIYCETECTAERTGKYDSRDEANYERMLATLIGKAAGGCGLPGHESETKGERDGKTKND